MDGIPLLSAVDLDVIPLDLVKSDGDLLELLSTVIITDYSELENSDESVTVEYSLSFSEEVSLSLVGLDGLEIVFGDGADSLVTIGWTGGLPDSFTTYLLGELKLRFDSNLLIPVVNNGDRFIPDPDNESINISLSAGIEMDKDLTISFTGGNSFFLDPVMIGDSGVVIEGEIAFDLSEKEALPESLALGFTEAWKGVVFKVITVHLPADINVAILPNDLTFENFHIGNGGISGDISGNWNNTFDENTGTFTGDGVGDLFGMPFALEEIGLSFYQNTIAGNTIKGSLVIPFFDLPINVDLGLTNDGDFTIALANPDGLILLEKENIIFIEVTSLEFIKVDSTFSIKLSGKITPLIAGLNWPSFELKGLTIGSDGTVKVDGGWIELPSQKALDFHGFQIEIAKLGFGSDEIDGVLYRWAGFSGGMQIAQGLPLSGGVEGLQVMWGIDEFGELLFKLKIGGVYLAFEIKGVLTFDGSVYFIDEPATEDHPAIKEFRGSVDLNLIPINLGIDAQFIAGKSTDYNYFYIAVDLDLPIGLPLGPPVLGLYGLAGLYGNNMTVNYKDLINYTDVDDRPNLTDASPDGPWYNEKGAMAFGAGLTVGTLPDSKFTAKAKALFVILIPGPILLIEGHAGMLSLNDSFMMQVLAVLDPNTGTFLLNISAAYQSPKPNGELLDISGSAEAYFSTANPSGWHLYLGENKPESKRIRADIYSFFKAQTYLMLNNGGLQMGAWIGYGLDKKYGVLRVVLESWMSGELSISTHPLQAKGTVTLYGNAELSAKIVKLGISVDADVTVQAPRPVSIEASLKVQLKMAVGKLKATIKLNWARPDVPPYPVPLSATLGIEHRKVAQNWDIQKSSIYQLDDDGFYLGSDTANTSFGNIPVVPPDVYMVLNFDKPMIDLGNPDNDTEALGSNPNMNTGYEVVGDYDFKYELLGVTLEYRDSWNETDDGEQWTDYSIFAADLVNEGLSEYKLSGTWQAIPGEDDMVNTKLVLNASTPFEISRLLEEKVTWFGLLDVYNPNYPCTDVPELEELCADFEEREHGYYYGLMEQDAYLFTSPYPMVVLGYDAPWLGTNSALMNADNYETMVCLNIKAQEETENFQLKTIEKVVFSAGIGYDSYLKLTDEYSNEDVELYISDSQFDIDNKFIPVFIHFPEISFDNIPLEVWITCIITDNTVFTAFDEVGNILDTQVIVDSNTIVQLKLTSAGDPIRKIGVLGNRIRLLDICYTVDHPVETMNILVTAPEDILKADVHLSKNSNGTIYVYDKDNAEVQQIPFDIPASLADDEVLPVLIETQSEEPFRSYLITGWYKIIRVCGVTEEAQEIYDYNANLEKHLQESLEENWGKHTEQILYPNKYYRLKIDTATSRRKNNDAWVAEDFTEYMYFKTGNPAGPTAGTQDEVGTEPKDRYDLDGSLRDLSPYVDYTVPIGATADAVQTRVYRSYDIGVAYNDSYIDQMYQMAGLSLKIRLLDNNNLPVLDAAGNTLEFLNLWGDNPELSLTEEETTYQDILDESGCITMISQDIETNVTSIASSRDLLLKPQTQYRAQLVAVDENEDEDGTSIFEFTFISSRYSNFMHQIHAFEDLAWDHFALLNDPGYTIDTVVLEQHLNNGEEEQVQFEQLMEHFDMNPRMTPERLEITSISDQNGSYGLLLESPEPFDWSRTELTVSHSNTSEVIEAHDGKIKIIGGKTDPSQWIDILVMESTGLADWVIEYRELGSTDEEAYQVYFQFPIGDTYLAGTRIRIHNGVEPIATTGDTEHISLYANNTTETLPLNGSQLRVLNFEAEIMHQRSILDSTTLFTKKDITLLKKEDESKCLLFVNNFSDLHSSLNTGIFKLDFTFQRDIGTSSTELKRFGFPEAEEATLLFLLP